MKGSRKAIVQSIVSKSQSVVKRNLQPVTEIFGSKVFNNEVCKARLPKDVYKKLMKTTQNRQSLDPSIASIVASVMKEWALENGATHFTHWFQPLGGRTAEKHDSFISVQKDGRVLMEFSGKELTQGEPDASSFPSGGLRVTFEARGYTAWDPLSPAFIKDSPQGGILCIPSVFFSYTGETLDLKTPLLRSQAALSDSAVKLLKLLGNPTKKVYTTAGVEQEYFLIDKEFYYQRPDLVGCGRTLFGNPPYKGQELEDHYFGSIKKRVLDFMQESERELYKIGIPITTRHNEVAPAQYEVAPIFTDANISTDQNLLVMDIMQEVAARHGLKMLLHEKPFTEINGSGKHCNWSMSNAAGQNLLEPGKTPEENLQFMLFLAAIVRAVDEYAELLRISIASAGNDHRLGANEAPPAILSIFLGDELEKVVASLVIGADHNPAKNKNMDLGVLTLPDLPKDQSDRNRTSPFAFTGNKFEFRALGSAQSASAPNYVLNTTVADSIAHVTEELKTALTANNNELPVAARSVLQKVFKAHSRVLFNGNNYSEEWKQEAEKRGLYNLRTCIDAFELYTTKKIVSLFEKYQVLSSRETESRKHVRTHKYNTTLEIEANATLDMARTIIYPACLEYEIKLKQATSGQALLPKVEASNQALLQAADTLEQKLALMPADTVKCGYYMRDVILAATEEVRKHADILEMLVDDDLWPLPKYREMLWIT